MQDPEEEHCLLNRLGLLPQVLELYCNLLLQQGVEGVFGGNDGVLGQCAFAVHVGIAV